MKQCRLLLAILMAIAFMPRAWAVELSDKWDYYEATTPVSVTINGITYLLYEEKIYESYLEVSWGDWVENKRDLKGTLYYASVKEINATGEVVIPESVSNGGINYKVAYIGMSPETSQSGSSQSVNIGNFFTGPKYVNVYCSYSSIKRNPISVSANGITKLTVNPAVEMTGELTAPSCQSIVFMKKADIKGTLTAASCKNVEFKEDATFDASLSCQQLTKLVFEGSYKQTKTNSLDCPSLTEIYFKTQTPMLANSWSNYSSSTAGNINVFLNESQATCNELKNYAAVWSEFNGVFPLPEQTNPTRTVKISISHGRIKIGDSSTYIVNSTDYQAAQYSDFTFHVTKLYGSEYLVKSVKLNGVDILDDMVLTEGATDAYSYYSYTISPLLNDVEIAIEGESIFNYAYAICSAGGTCLWSTQPLSLITPNSRSSVRWLKDSQQPPELLIYPNEGYTLERVYFNNFDNTYRAKSNEDGTFSYQAMADANLSVVFKEIPPTQKWDVALLSDGQLVTAELTDKRDGTYTYTLTTGENTVIDEPKSIAIRINGTGIPFVMADGVDVSSSLEFGSDYIDMDEYGNPITEDYYSGTIPLENLDATNWVIGLKSGEQIVWSSALKGEAEGGSFTMSGGNMTDGLNLSNDDREGIFVDDVANPTIVSGFNLTSTLAVPKGYTFTVKFNDTDLSSYYTHSSMTESAVNYSATFDGSQADLAALINSGAWVVEFTKSTADIIEFADANVKAICVANWDTDRDGELSKAEAAAVTTLIDSGTNKSVFYGNSTITSFDEFQYFTGLTNIEDRAFNNCYQLNSVVLPSTIQTIGKYAFYTCYKLEHINFPSSVTKLGNYCFGSVGLKTVYVPKTITSIGESVFSGSYLVGIVVDPKNTVYDSRSNCNGIIQKSNNYLIAACDSTIIPETTAGIGGWTFSGSGKKEINIPAKVSYIGGWAFNNCHQLKKVVMNSKTPSMTFDNYIFTSNSSATIEPPVLVVPAGTKDAYAEKGWKSSADGGYFKEVVEAEPEISSGDINGDGTISIADVTKLVNMILGKE